MAKNNKLPLTEEERIELNTVCEEFGSGTEEYRKVYNKFWRKYNRQRCREDHKRWYEENKEKAHAATRKWMKENKEHRTAWMANYMNEYRKTEKGKENCLRAKEKYEKKLKGDSK